MKILTSQQDPIFDIHANSTREVARLQSEIRDWKSRYSQLKVQSRSSLSSHLTSPIRIDLKSRLVTSEDGIIEDVSISRFQTSIDELLIAARRDDTEILDIMTEVVKATRSITDDLKRNGPRNIDEDPKIRKLTQRLSATANNLITATKNHISSQGISPVSLVDAAASHLTTTVIEIVKLVKIKSSTEEESHSDHSRYSELATPLTSPLSPAKSIPIRISNRPIEILPESPRTIDSRRSSSRNYISKDEEELRIYLDTQTQAIVESIQHLLSRIRNPKLDMLDDFLPQIDEIIGIVEKIVDFTEKQGIKIERLGSDNNRLQTVLQNLQDCCGYMKNVTSSTEDGFKKRLARIAFDISKQIKVPPIFASIKY
jgi:G protein-coupled receptor kinase-interacting protein 1 C term